MTNNLTSLDSSIIPVSIINTNLHYVTLDNANYKWVEILYQYLPVPNNQSVQVKNTTTAIQPSTVTLPIDL